MNSLQLSCSNGQSQSLPCFVWWLLQVKHPLTHAYTHTPPKSFWRILWNLSYIIFLEKEILNFQKTCLANCLHYFRGHSLEHKKIFQRQSHLCLVQEGLRCGEPTFFHLCICPHTDVKMLFKSSPLSADILHNIVHRHAHPASYTHHTHVPQSIYTHTHTTHTTYPTLTQQSEMTSPPNSQRNGNALKGNILVCFLCVYNVVISFSSDTGLSVKTSVWNMVWKAGLSLWCHFAQCPPSPWRLQPQWPSTSSSDVSLLSPILGSWRFGDTLPKILVFLWPLFPDNPHSSSMRLSLECQALPSSFL